MNNNLSIEFKLCPTMVFDVEDEDATNGQGSIFWGKHGGSNQEQYLGILCQLKRRSAVAVGKSGIWKLKTWIVEIARSLPLAMALTVRALVKLALTCTRKSGNVSITSQ